MPRQPLLLITLLLVLAFASSCGLRELPGDTRATTAPATITPAVEGSDNATSVPPTEGESGNAHATATTAPAAEGALTGDVPAAPEGVTPIDSIYNESISPQPAERIIISEVFLLLEAGQLLVETNWDGSNDTPLPLTIEQFEADSLEAYLADERSDDEALTIPPELRDLYLSDGAVEEIGALMLSANREFVGYVEAQGTLPLYLEELEWVLPAEPGRMEYHPINDPDTDPTAVTPIDETVDGVTDHSRLQMDAYPVDIYNRAMLLERTRILGEPPEESDDYYEYHARLRDMALRQLMYHEMTHALQRAYLLAHIENPNDRLSASYVYASKTMANSVDTQYHWNWGDPYFAESYNSHVSGESQAEGISYEIFVNLYDLSGAQKAAVWEHFFGRLEESRDTLNEAMTLFEEEYPEFSPDDMGTLLADVMSQHPSREKGYTLWQVCFRLISLPAYVGYLNPMLPEDTPKFWEALRQP